MEFKDYYEILSIDKSTNAEEIRKAYRKLARKYHPDVNPNDQAAAERFKALNEAHQVLTDPEARAKYDRLRVSWENHQRSGTQEGFDWSQWTSELDPATPPAETEAPPTSDDKPDEFSDFFHAIFDESKPEQEPPTPQKGEDYHQEVEITLEEAFTGTARILQVGSRRMEVRIPRGAKTGTKIRVRGEGPTGSGNGAKGDLYLEILVKPHASFERIGDDLHLELPVNLYSAILGGEAIVPTLKGVIKLKIPPETQSGRTFRLKGQGMPGLKNPEDRGDLYAKVMVTLPENLTDQEIELFEELADIRGL